MNDQVLVSVGRFLLDMLVEKEALIRSNEQLQGQVEALKKRLPAEDAPKPTDPATIGPLGKTAKAAKK